MRAIIIIQDFDVVSRDYCFFGPVAQPKINEAINSMPKRVVAINERNGLPIPI
jgi:hypothetical protein